MERQNQVPGIDPKVQRTLHLIEEAQGLINDAARELSSVDGYRDEWSRLGKLHCEIKDHWQLIDSRESQLRISRSGRIRMIRVSPIFV